MHYINPRAGAGKTTAAIEYVVDNIPKNLNLSYLIIAPTTKLIDQITTDLKVELTKQGLGRIPVNTIYKKSPLLRNNPAKAKKKVSVKSILRKHMTNDVHPQIIITTHKSFINLIDIDLKQGLSGNYRNNFMLIIDEVLDVISGQLIKSKQLSVVESLFDITEKQTIRAKDDPEALKDIAKLSNTGTHEDPFLNIPVLADLCKGYWYDCYKLITKVHKNNKSKPEKITSIEYRSTLDPCIIDKFQNPTILSAYFDKSPMYYIWKLLGVEFILEEKLAARVKYPTHSNAHLITFNYLQDKHEWITTRFDVDIQEHAASEIINHLKSNGISEDNILVRYKGIKNDLDGAKKLDGKAYGHNDLTHITHAIYLQTQMPDTVIKNLLKSKGITQNQIREAFYHLEAYQSIMRCAIRDHKNTEKVEVFVGDFSTAKFLHNCFEGKSNIKKFKVDCIENYINVKEENKFNLQTKHHTFCSNRMKSINTKYNQTLETKVVSEQLNVVLKTNKDLDPNSDEDWKKIRGIMTEWEIATFKKSKNSSI